MIDILVCPREGSTGASCAPAALLGEMLASGFLPNFNRAFNQPEQTSIREAHEIAYALLADLISARRAEGWYWAEGMCRFGEGKSFQHKWLEIDGWALDIANRKLVIMDASTYRQVSRAEEVQTTCAA